MQLEKLEQRVNTSILATMIAASGGAEVDMPDPEKERIKFDEELNAIPAEKTEKDSITDEIRRALGLKG